LPHRVELYDIDLRWGITEDEAKNDKVISLCLDQVDECRPFFLAFIGHRYGWVPGQVPEETRRRFPFVTLYPGVRVTELELRPETAAEVDPLDAEADLHERFLELRTRIYIGREDLYRRLHDFALADGEVPLLLTGESGLGKSAALARFVRDFREGHPDSFVLP